jgi:hypothetical protein
MSAGQWRRSMRACSVGLGSAGASPPILHFCARDAVLATPTRGEAELC